MATSQTGASQQQVSRWRKSLTNKAKYREKMILAAYKKAELVPADNHHPEGTGENDWFTPSPSVVAGNLRFTYEHRDGISSDRLAAGIAAYRKIKMGPG